MAAFALVCHDCATLSEVRKTRTAHRPAMELHDGHDAEVCGSQWAACAADLAPLLPYTFRQMYWERKLDEFFIHASGNVDDHFVATPDGIRPR